MEILALILDKLKDLDARVALTCAAIYIAVPLIVFCNVQLWKRDRKRIGKPLQAVTIFWTAALATGFLGFIVGIRFGRWPMGEALNHAVSIAIAYPIAIRIWMNRIKQYDKELAEDLGSEATEFNRLDPPPP